LQGELQDATLTLVGEGPVRKRLEQLAEKLLPAESYRFMPPMPVSEIFGLMGKHHIYVLPSNGYEGWGVVVNEAMSMGTAVVASAATGSANSMIRHKINGLLFQPADWRGLSNMLCLLGRDEEMRLQIAREGQRNVVECWSPAVAAKRFLLLSEALLMERPVPLFSDGPMAPVWP
jgi:glycosyltransferase involved in cell wall biosynthesis